MAGPFRTNGSGPHLSSGQRPCPFTMVDNHAENAAIFVRSAENFMLLCGKIMNLNKIISVEFGWLEWKDTRADVFRWEISLVYSVEIQRYFTKTKSDQKMVNIRNHCIFLPCFRFAFASFRRCGKIAGMSEIVRFSVPV
ncbi:hypothetical protein [Pseudooceanicola sp.]|uniref:hypothetical protein n=1 Tax=Pseudooceanicola sp. TaxID=1914328 RepID=UPI0035C676EF